MQYRKKIQNNYKEYETDKNRDLFTGIFLSLAAVTIVTKLLGFAEKLVIANFFGTSDTADVYFASMGVVLALVFFVKELVYPSLLPVFAESLSKNSLSSAILFKKFFTCSALILAFIAITQALFPQLFANLLAPGFNHSKKIAMSKMLRFLSPTVFFLGLATITYTILNAHKKFLKAAWPKAAFKLIIVIGLIALIPALGIYAVAPVFAFGAVVLLLTQLFFIPEHRSLLNPLNKIPDDSIKKVLTLLMPLLIGVAFSQISELILNILASTLPTGNLSFLSYSKKIINALMLIIPVALVTVIYAQLAHAYSSADYKKFEKLFIHALRFLLFVTVPLSVLLIFLRTPIIKFLFERGQFQHNSTIGTSLAFLIYASGFVILSTETLLVHTFYASSNTKTPVKTGIFSNCLSILLALIFLKPLGFIGIALAFVISKTIKVIILSALLAKKLKATINKSFADFIIKLAAATIPAAILLSLLSDTNFHKDLLNLTLFALFLPTAGFLTAFTLLSYLFKIEELKKLIDSLIKGKNKCFYLLGKQR